MTNLDDLERLHALKEKGILSQEEFEQQKEELLNKSDTSDKSDKPAQENQRKQSVYCILALFLGGLGIHNFYAGRWKRGLAQLLLGLTSPITFFMGAIISNLWAIVNIFSIHTDGKGKEFEPSSTAKCVCGILGILLSLLIFGVLFIGGLAGYTMAMRRHRSHQALSYASDVYVVLSSARIQNAVSCNELVPNVPDVLKSVSCTAYPLSQGIVVFEDVDENLKEDLLQRGMVPGRYGELYFNPNN